VLLSWFISLKQFGFLFNRQIFDAMGSTKEGVHYVSVDEIPRAVTKIDLAKSYDKVYSLYLRLLSLQIGMNV